MFDIQHNNTNGAVGPAQGNPIPLDPNYLSGLTSISDVITIIVNSLGNDRLAQVASGTVKARLAAGVGNVEDVTLAALGLVMNGFQGQHADLSALNTAVPSPADNSLAYLDDRTGAAGGLTDAGLVYYDGVQWVSLAIGGSSNDAGMKGSFADSTALTTAVTTPVTGDTALVKDTTGMTGGLAEMAGLAYYNGTIWQIVQVFDPSESLVFADDTSVAPSTAGAPTATEIETWNNGLVSPHRDTVVEYTGTDVATDPVTYVFTIDEAGNATLLRDPNVGTEKLKATVNGAEVVYQTVTGTPTITVDKTTPSAPVYGATGGTVKFIEVRDSVNFATSTNPVFTFNGVFDSAQSSRPTHVIKYSGGNQQDDDTTPQIITPPGTTSQVAVTLNAVTGTWDFTFFWGNQI